MERSLKPYARGSAGTLRVLFVVAVLTAPLDAAPLLVNPEFADGASGWTLRSRTTIESSSRGGIDLATLQPPVPQDEGGIEQCVASIPAIVPGSLLVAHFIVTPLENDGGNRGQLTFFSEEGCVGTPIASNFFGPLVATTMNPRGTPVEVSDTVFIPAAAKSVRFAALAFTSRSDVFYSFNVEDPALDTEEDSPPPPSADVIPLPSAPLVRRSGQTARDVLQVLNQGQGHTMGVRTITMTAPVGFRLRCKDIVAECTGNETYKLVVTETTNLEPGEHGRQTELIIDPGNVPPGDYEIVVTVAGGGDTNVGNNTVVQMFTVLPAREGEREPDATPQQVNGRGRQGGGE